MEVYIMNIAKRKTEFGYAFDIVTDEGCFIIEYRGNLDLYFRCQYQGSILKCEDKLDFYITKENYYLYSLFDTLYNRVKNYEIFSNDQNEKSHNEFWLEEDVDTNQRIRERDTYNPRRLFQNNCIKWHSDDYNYEDASVLEIGKLEDMYQITFHKGKEWGDFFTYAVRIRTHGSRYGYFCMVFMDLYHALCHYDEEYHQIHMEEYLYQKKRVKKKETI